MKRKLLLTILAAAVLAAGLLSGCSKAPDSEAFTMEAAVIDNRDAQLLVVKVDSEGEIYLMDISEAAITGAEDEELPMTDILMGDLVQITYIGLTEEERYTAVDNCNAVQVLGPAGDEYQVFAQEFMTAWSAFEKAEEAEPEDSVVDHTIPAITGTVLQVWSEPRLTVFENGKPNMIYDVTLAEGCVVLDENEQQISHTDIPAGKAIRLTFDGVMVNTSPITISNCIAVIVTGDGDQAETDAATANLAVINGETELHVPELTDSPADETPSEELSADGLESETDPQQ